MNVSLMFIIQIETSSVALRLNEFGALNTKKSRTGSRSAFCFWCEAYLVDVLYSMINSPFFSQSACSSAVAFGEKKPN